MKTNEKTHVNTTQQEGKEEITMQENTLIQEISPEGGNGMKGTLEQLITESQALAEKRAWIRESYDELMKRLNERLKAIPDMPEIPIRYVVCEWAGRETGFRHRIRLVLHFEFGAHLALDERYEDESGWNTDPLYHPDPETMQAVSEQLGEALEYFLERIRERNGDYDPAIAVLTELIAKLQ